MSKQKDELLSPELTPELKELYEKLEPSVSSFHSPSLFVQILDKTLAILEPFSNIESALPDNPHVPDDQMYLWSVSRSSQKTPIGITVGHIKKAAAYYAILKKIRSKI